jgi:diguanylate cyclase (GGDEF)-like protein
MNRIIFFITLIFLSGSLAAKDFDVLKIQESNDILEYKKYVIFYTNNNIPTKETDYYYYFKSFIESSKGNYKHSNVIISNNLLNKDYAIKGFVYKLQGKNYFLLKENKKSINSYEKALGIFKKSKNDLNISKTHIALSEIYFELGFFNKSLVNLRIVIDNIKNINDKDLIITVYQLLGDIYSELFLYEEAKTAYQSAIDLINKTHSLNYSFISEIYYKYSKNEIKLNNILEANKYTKKGLNICNIEKDSNCIVKFKILESGILLCNQLFLESLRSINEAALLVDEEHVLYPKILLQKFKINFLKKDILELDKLMILISHLNANQFVDEVVYQETLYQYYSLKGDKDNAFIHLEKYHNIYKNKYKADVLNRISELKTVLDFEVELQKNNSLEKINSQNELVIKQQYNINKWQRVAIIAILISLAFSIFFAIRNVKIKREIKKMADIDSLTQLKNRRAIAEISKKLYCDKNEFAVILFDIDHFKRVNDTFGHQAGDEVLKQISDVSSKALRDTDHLARYGGEEFIIFLPSCKIERAKEIAERVRLDIENINYDNLEEGLKITSSFGVSVYDAKLGLKDIIAEADNKLYVSKDNGRNKVS